MSDILRITGLATGIDTESMIQQLMKAEYIRVDKVKQERQYIEWQIEEYRDIISVLRGFRDEYFDILKPQTNLRFASTFNTYEATAKINGVETSVVTINALSSATPGTHTITEITQLATKDVWSSNNNVSAAMVGGAIDFVNLNANDTFKLTLDGVTKTITLDAAAASAGDANTLAQELQRLVNDAFGTGNIAVDDDGAGHLVFSATGHTLEIIDSGDGTVTELGFTSGDQNTLDLNKTLETANLANAVTFNADGNVIIEINGKQFIFNKTDKIEDVINEINSSDIGVTISYSSINDKFVIQSDSEGTVNAIQFDDIEGNLLKGVFDLSLNSQTAQDAQFTLDGVTTTRSSNTFTIDGVEYSLNSTYSNVNPPIEIGINSNPDEIIEKIKGFVEKYNEVISKINSKLIEEKYYDYKPLTDDQKEEMSEDEIELWEEKAKSGILRSDPLLEKIVNDMRRALYDSIEGVGISLYDIGITTSSYYQDRGKLVIDETKLRQALENNPDEVIQLFTKESSIDYDDTTNRSQRYVEEGLAQRLYDILQDNIRITRDNNGKKGLLLEKAGMEGDITYYNNILYAQLEDYNERIDELMIDLTEKEDYYYIMFSKMETAIQQMNAQMSWLMSQTGGGM